MALPSAIEARPIAFEKSYAELVAGDQIGPADVLQSVTYTVIAVPEQSTEDRFQFVAPVQLQDESNGNLILRRARRSDTVFVRRYFATITVTRAGGAIDARKPKMWFRPVGDTVTLDDAWKLKLQPGDKITMVAA